MKKLNFDDFIFGLRDLFMRFPIAVVLAFMMTMRQIKLDEFFISDSYMTSIFIVGILLSVVSQMIYEHFYLNQSSKRWLLKGAAIALILFYAWYMHSSLSLVDDEFWFFYSIPGIRVMIVYFFLSVLLI